MTVPLISKVNVTVKSTSASTSILRVDSSFAEHVRVALNSSTLLSKAIFSLPDVDSSNDVGLEKEGAGGTGSVDATRENATERPLKTLNMHCKNMGYGCTPGDRFAEVRVDLQQMDLRCCAAPPSDLQGIIGRKGLVRWHPMLCHPSKRPCSTLPGYDM